MKRNIIISIISLFLISCNIPEQINFNLINNSNSDILISKHRDTSIINRMKGTKEFKLEMNINYNNITKTKSKVIRDFSSTELSSYLSSNDKIYIFYYAKIIQKENIIKFQNQFDSLMINVDDLKIGKDKMNNMIFENDKLILNKK